MRRGSWAEDPAFLWAASEQGVIRAMALMAMGVPERTIYARCRDGGPWQRLLPGIVLLTTGVPTPDQKVIAALLLGGADAIITGLEACRRHGVRRGPRGDGEIQILVPHTRQVRTIGFVHVERTTRMPTPVIRGGVPLAPVPRASIDAARRIRDRGDIAELLSDSVQRRLCTVAALNHELSECSRRGTATPRNVLAGVAAGIRSAAELDARRLWAATGLPEPWWNARVYTLDGRLIGIPDGWFDDVALAWEVDSTEYHLSPKDHDRSVAKAAAYAAAGIIYLPTKPSALRLDKKVVRATLLAAFAQAANRPKPALIVKRI